MRSRFLIGLATLPLVAQGLILNVAQANGPAAARVTVDNFAQAESDRYMAAIAKRYGVGRLEHNRQVASIDQQTVIRLNRDTLYSVGVFDLEAGPLTLTLPDSGKRYLSLQVINEQHYVPAVFYGAGTHRLTRDAMGSRYIAIALRILANPADVQDMQQAHALQDAVRVEQTGAAGQLELPQWDGESQGKVRSALLALAALEPDLNRAFGAQGQVDPVRHLIASASAWGGFPEKDATYLNVTPARNDGSTLYRLHVKDVPVDAFWSVSVYNAKGYFEPNPLGAYNLNSVTAQRGEDGSIDVAFGGCDGKRPNCLPIMPGWNYMVRLYQPQPAVLEGSWRFPEAALAN